MIQQVLAVILIIFFLLRLSWQKKNNQISFSEFIFWLFFWIIACLAIFFIKKIDNLVSGLGFSGSGIEVLIYFSIFILFYLIFRLRLKIEKMEKNITKIVRNLAINEKEDKE